MAYIKPIFLLADSQLLFWNDKCNLFLNRLHEYFDKAKKIENVKACYIGASNGDNPAYFDIFRTAMKQIGVINCRMIPSNPDTSDMDFLDLLDILLLAGGEVKRGWDVFKRNNFIKIIMDKYHEGALLIGLSAGAIQLGLKGWDEGNKKSKILFDTFKIIPYVIDVHNENSNWKLLHSVIENGEDYCKCLGIPFGGGLVFYPNGSIEAVRYSLTEIVKEKDCVKQSLILPPVECVKT